MSNISTSLKYKGNVCISGLTASGKTTHSHLLAGEFGLTYVSASQILLNLLGISPIQSKDFWITKEAKTLWNEDNFKKVDEELLRIEAANTGCIFDTISMPWRHKCPALCIWLQSDINSRVIKSYISHHKDNKYDVESYMQNISSKDYGSNALHERLYGIEIGKDLTCFNLVLDISSFITVPSLNDSFLSISKAHKIIREAVGYYLVKSPEFKEKFIDVANEYSKYILFNSLL